MIFDESLSFEKYITKISQISFAHLRNITRIRKYLSQSDCEKLVHAFISSRLDSCNSLLAGLPATKLAPLIRVQRAAARLVVRARKFDPITEVMQRLHWLPVQERIDFKYLLLVFKCVHGLGPPYLSDLLSWHSPNRSLRSKNNYLLKEKSAKQSRIGGNKPKKLYADRAFENLAPRLWNSLPLDIRSTENLSTFKTRLKTYLFQKSYNLN